MTVSVGDDGTIKFLDADGNPASEYLIEQAKKQQGDAIRVTIQKKCDEINGQVDALAELHHNSPAPDNVPVYHPAEFDQPRPVQPTPKVPGFFARLFKSKVAKIEAANAKAQADCQKAVGEWEAAKARHDADERKKRAMVFHAISGEPEAMETFLGEVLYDIVWPRETLVSFEVGNQGRTLAFDVNLPEIEDMPNKTASAPQRGFKLSLKDMPVTYVQKLYARHIHSIGFRLLGEAFGMLPTVQEVVLSGYSQRRNKATGQEQDDYLFSVRALRQDWQQIDFGALPSLDVVEALAQFELRRDMSKTGLFKPIEPIR